jgi:hypothetical protein
MCVAFIYLNGSYVKDSWSIPYVSNTSNNSKCEMNASKSDIDKSIS